MGETKRNQAPTEQLTSRENQWAERRANGQKKSAGVELTLPLPRHRDHCLLIDFHYGWDEMAHAKNHPMLHMYAGIADRIKQILVTAFF